MGVGADEGGGSSSRRLTGENASSVHRFRINSLFDVLTSAETGKLA